MRRRSGSTSRSACNTCSPIAPSCCERRRGSVVVLETLILVRHAHAASNAGDTINGIPPGDGLSPQGAAEALALGSQLEDEPIELGVCSRFRRSSETLALALAGRDVPIVVEHGLDEIGFGSFEGGSLAAYRAWAWKHPPEAACPGGGETRPEAARRTAGGLPRPP